MDRRKSQIEVEYFPTNGHWNFHICKIDGTVNIHGEDFPTKQVAKKCANQLLRHFHVEKAVHVNRIPKNYKPKTQII